MIQDIEVNKDEVGVGVVENGTKKSELAKYIKDFLVYNMSNELKTALNTTLANEIVDVESTDQEFLYSINGERTEFVYEPEESAESGLTDSDNYVMRPCNLIVNNESEFILDPVSPEKNNFKAYNSHSGQHPVDDSELSLNDKNLNLPQKSIYRSPFVSHKRVIKGKGFLSHKQHKIGKLRFRNNLKNNMGNIRQFSVDSNLVKEKLNETISNSEILSDSLRMPIAEESSDAKEEFSEHKMSDSQFVEPSLNGNYCSKQRYQDCVVKIERLPILDRLLSSKKQNPSWDICVCDLCEPKRLFLSKIALKGHIYEQHLDSLVLKMVSKVSLGSTCNNNLVTLPIVCQNVSSHKNTTDNKIYERKVMSNSVMSEKN